MAAANCPRPCMEKTAAIMAPRQRVGANLSHEYKFLIHIYFVEVDGEGKGRGKEGEVLVWACFVFYQKRK